MKRSQLKRRSELRTKTRLPRRAELRAAPVARSTRSSTSKRGGGTRAPSDPRAVEFKQIAPGRCACCGKQGWVRRHHVITEQRIRKEGGDEFDLRWGMWIGLGSEAGVLHTCDCHAQHHAALKHGQPWRIPVSAIPDAAIDAAIELLGRDRAALEVSRYYAPAVTGGDNHDRRYP